MHDGSPSGHVTVNWLLLIIFLILVLPFLWKLVRGPRMIIHISDAGILDTRLYREPIPWKKIQSVNLIRASWFDRDTSHIDIAVPKKYLVDELGAESKANFGRYDADGNVLIRIDRPNLFFGPDKLFPDIKAYWERYRAEP